MTDQITLQVKPQLVLMMDCLIRPELKSSIAKEAMWQIHYAQELYEDALRNDPAEAFIDWNKNVLIGFNPEEDCYNVQFTRKDGSLESENWMATDSEYGFTPALQNDNFKLDLLTLSKFLGLKKQD